MGQSASKVASKAAQKVAKKVTDVVQPTSGATAPQAAVTPKNSPITTNVTATNPAAFLRGSGIAEEDIRDKAQEMYLRNLHQVDDETMSKGPPDMPKDLLKFIQDVGPAKQSLDKDFTSPRLLAKGNESELKKTESERKVTRERIKMPLMGEDDSFTTTRNINFSRVSTQDGDAKDFGLSNVQLYQLLKRKDNEIDSFYGSIMSEENVSLWSEQEKAQHQQLLKDAWKAIDIPVLRRDTKGNFLGLYAKDVPGTEVMSIQPIPETKVKLVLQDLTEKEERSGDVAAAKLERRRQLRRGNS